MWGGRGRSHPSGIADLGRFGLWQRMAVIAAVALVFWMVQELNRHPVQIPVKAAPYLWTEACPEAEYKRYDHIPGGCAREEYLIPNPQDYPIRYYGLGRELSYYRVGNQIVDIICPGPAQDSQCEVHHVLTDAFVQ